MSFTHRMPANFPVSSNADNREIHSNMSRRISSRDQHIFMKPPSESLGREQLYPIRLPPVYLFPENVNIYTIFPDIRIAWPSYLYNGNHFTCKTELRPPPPPPGPFQYPIRRRILGSCKVSKPWACTRVPVLISLCDLIGDSAALLWRLPEFRAIGKLYIPILRLSRFCEILWYDVLSIWNGPQFVTSPLPASLHCSRYI